jgi:hypothetical protein
MPALYDVSVVTIKLEYKWPFRASFNVLLLIPKELSEILHFVFFLNTNQYHRTKCNVIWCKTKGTH